MRMYAGKKSWRNLNMADLVCKQTRVVRFYFDDIRSVSRLCVKPMWYLCLIRMYKNKDINLDTMSFEHFSMLTANFYRKYLYIRRKLTEVGIDDLAARQKPWYFIVPRNFRSMNFFHLSIWLHHCKFFLSIIDRFLIYFSFI